MIFLENCWEKINASECDFGAHYFGVNEFAVYVHGGIDVGLDFLHNFKKIQNGSRVGACVFSFKEINFVEITTQKYSRNYDEIAWEPAKVCRYQGDATTVDAKDYYLGGGFLG